MTSESTTEQSVPIWSTFWIASYARSIIDVERVHRLYVSSIALWRLSNASSQQLCASGCSW
jgi:hypothetical protein